MIDLVVLAADSNMQAVTQSLLKRHQALGIRPITFQIYVHPRRDPGCATDSAQFMKAFSTSFAFALVVFDHQGSGHESQAASSVATTVTRQLEANGWKDRAHTVVIAPELEIWAWSPSQHVADCLGWENRYADLRQWLEHTNRWPQGQHKPTDPKGALEAALRVSGRPRSSALYAELASKVSLRGHTEPAFTSLIAALQKWFPEHDLPTKVEV